MQESGLQIGIEGKKFSKFTNDLAQEIINTIKSLPEPEVVSCDSSPIEEDEAVLCLQREMAYVDSSNTKSKTRYVGSKNVFGCILVYVYNNTEHLVAHVDSDSNFDLTDILFKFNSKEGIKCTLVGGDSATPEVSYNILNVAIKALFQVSEKLNITITIASQKLIEKNHFTEDSKYQFAYDVICYKADIFFRQFFKRPLPSDTFKNYKAEDLRSGKNKNSSPMPLSMFVKVLGKIAELYDSWDIIEPLFTFLTNKKYNKEAFSENIYSIFSMEGFRQIAECNVVSENSCPTVQLHNFVFDIQTKKIHVINRLIKTPDENIRHLLYMDNIYRKNDNYFQCYDGHASMWIKPELSETYLFICHSIKDNLRHNYIVGNKAEIAKILQIKSSVESIHFFIEHMQFVLNEKTIQQSGIASIQRANIKQSFFQPDIVESTHQKLLIDIANLIKNYPKAAVEFFLESIKNKNYSQALRVVCTHTNHEFALNLIKVLFKYKVELKLDNTAINEQVGKERYSALHHLARKGNQKAYDYLISEGADKTLKDDVKGGNTPEDYLKSFMQNQETQKMTKK